jgi:hypothetical protein
VAEGVGHVASPAPAAPAAAGEGRARPRHPGLLHGWLTMELCFCYYLA